MQISFPKVLENNFLVSQKSLDIHILFMTKVTGWENSIFWTKVWHSCRVVFFTQSHFSFVGTVIVLIDKPGLNKGTVSWDIIQKFWQQFTELGLSKRRGWFLTFLGVSDDFIMQTVYLFRLMPVWVGLTMLSCLYLSVPPIASGV